MVASPISTFSDSVFIDWIFELILYTLAHHVFHFIHPVFHIFLVWVNLLYKVDFFFLSWKHSNYHFFIVELDGIYVFEHFFEVRLYCRGFFSLRQDLKQVIIWQEIESCKFFSFLLKIFV